MMKLWAAHSYMYSLFGGQLGTCAFCEKWYASNWWTRCTFGISVGILQIFMPLCEIKCCHPMTALMTSVFAGVCAVDGQLEFTIAECVNTACCIEKMLQSLRNLHFWMMMANINVVLIHVHVAALVMCIFHHLITADPSCMLWVLSTIDTALSS